MRQKIALHGLMKPNLNSTSTEIEKHCVLGKPGTTHHSSHSIPTMKHGDASIALVWVGVFFFPSFLQLGLLVEE